MIKNIYIFIFIVLNFFGFSQADTLLKKQIKINHLIGIDFGYSKYFKIVDFKGETNVNYIFNPHLFCIKVQIGIAPSTYFGNLMKTKASMGFSTRINKPVSWHFLTGLGIVYSPVNKSENSSFTAGPFFIESGLYFNLFKKRNIFIGLNTMACRMSYYYDNGNSPGIYNSYSNNSYAYNINFSFNYRLNSQKKLD